VVSLSGGTLSMGAVEILVKGAPSLPVRKLTGSSKTFGTMNLAWTAPKYTGGAKITGYVVKATASGAPTVTKTVTSNTLKLTGLKNGKRYTISVIAVTKNGNSDAVKISVPVS
jgi:fibronectin type 3 domain-containing protein